MDQSWVAGALQRARVARLGTVGGDGMIGLVPICFAVVDGWVASAVDHKPKRTGQLRRLDDIEAAGSATVLVDHYDEDWSRSGGYAFAAQREQVDREHDAVAVVVLAASATKYTQYRERPPAGAVYRVAIDDMRSWSVCWTACDPRPRLRQSPRAKRDVVSPTKMSAERPAERRRGARAGRCRTACTCVCNHP